MRKVFVVVPLAVLAVGGSTACATKGHVRASVGEVNRKVDSLGRSLENTQERTRKNEQRISEVDQKVLTVDAKARAAGEVATGAASTASAAGARVDALDKATKRLGYDLVLSEDQGNFAFGGTELPAAAKSRIDALIGALKRDPKNVHIEIEGHTDNVGDPAVNARIGLVRAGAVQRYLYEQYQIPLHRMNVISYGEEKPVAPNSTRAGRAQNRRVVIRIVA